MQDLLLCLSVIAFISCCSMLSWDALSSGLGSDLNENAVVREHQYPMYHNIHAFPPGRGKVQTKFSFLLQT